MFGAKESHADLEKRYNKLMEESFKLSHTNRKQSDLKAAEADEIRIKLEEMEKNGNR